MMILEQHYGRYHLRSLFHRAKLAQGRGAYNHIIAIHSPQVSAFLPYRWAEEAVPVEAMFPPGAHRESGRAAGHFPRWPPQQGSASNDLTPFLGLEGAGRGS